MRNILVKLGVASTTSMVLTESINLEPLWQGLLTVATSILSVVAVEGVTWLRNYIKSKTIKVQDDNKEE